MVEQTVQEPDARENIGMNRMILTSVWVMNRKQMATLVLIETRGFNQVDSLHDDEDSIATFITKEMIIHPMVVLYWNANVLDVQGTFLMKVLKMVRICTWKYQRGVNG